MCKKIRQATYQESREHRMCFYCQKIFAAGYHAPHSRLVCSGILPQKEWLWFLMRAISANNVCDGFKERER